MPAWLCQIVSHIAAVVRRLTTYTKCLATCHEDSLTPTRPNRPNRQDGPRIPLVFAPGLPARAPPVTAPPADRSTGHEVHREYRWGAWGLGGAGRL